MTEMLMPAMKPELRSAFIAPLQKVEIRQSGNGKDMTFTGSAVVFNSWSEALWTPMGIFRERILPGAFDSVLETADVRLLINHDPNLVVARTKSGTMQLTQTDEALKVWARLDPSDPDVQRLNSKMSRGDIDQMSFQFEMDPEKGAEDSWYENADGQVCRDVVKVSDLFDVCPVTFPAYEDTSASLRELRHAINTGRVAPRKPANEERQRYKRTLQAIGEKPWAILPASLAMIVAIVHSRSEGNRLTADEIRERIGTEKRDGTPSQGSVAVIPIVGPIVPRADAFTEVSGLTSVMGLQEALRAAVADPSVSAIVLDIDSPGGVVDLVPEIANEIRAARDVKPVVAAANTMAASAAYWIASAASEIAVTQSGEVGSIGVYAAHQDISAFQEKLGVKTTLVSAGKYKVEGNPFEPLSDEAKAEIQRGVDDYYRMFVAAVAKGRGVSVEKVRSDFGQGRMLNAQDALKAGMVDSVETIDEVIARLAKPRRAAAAEDPSGEQAPTAALQVDGDKGDRAALPAGQESTVSELRERADKAVRVAKADHRRLLREFGPPA